MDEPDQRPPSDATPEDPSHWSDALRLTPAEVVRRRMTVLLALRCVGCACGLLIMGPLGSWLAEGLRDDDLLDLYYYAPRLILAAILAAVTLLTFLAGPRIARKLVPLSTSARCPSCGFDLRGLAAPRCPECGLVFSPRETARRPPWQFQTWLVAAVLVLRLIAVTFTFFMAVLTASTLVSLYYEPESIAYVLLYPFMGERELSVTLLRVGAAIGPGIALWFLAPLIARRALRVGRSSIRG